MKRTAARIINKLISPFGLRCVVAPKLSPAPELPDAYLKDARIVPERSAILPHVPKGGVVAEIGVGFGNYSRKILDIVQPSHFVAVDTFGLDRRSWLGRQPYADILGGKSHEDFYRDRFSAEIDKGVVSLKKGFSVDVMEGFPDDQFDMIYIDANHTFESVKADLAVSARKIKDTGWLILNDYTVVDPLLLMPYDIVRAVHEFCLEEGWKIELFALHRFMFCDVALRRLDT